MDNQIVSKFFDHPDFTPYVDGAVRQVCKEYGFDPTGIVHKRHIYCPDKLWRVRIKGVWQKLPAMLRIENMRLESDEEKIRQAFRVQCKGAKVRPPETYVARPYDETRGYAFSIEEYVDGEPLFDPASAPESAWSFAPFYRELRNAVYEPFWDCPEIDASAYSVAKMAEWHLIAARKFPERTQSLDKVVSRLMAHSLDLLGDSPLRFQHAHLAGDDIRESKHGDWVVFANHFWRWGQAGYDVMLPMWSMWLSLPHERRNAKEVSHITDIWLTMCRDSLSDLISPDETLSMVLNRLYGALLVDVPAKHGSEKAEHTQALEEALLDESERILTAINRHSALP